MSLACVVCLRGGVAECTGQGAGASRVALEVACLTTWLRRRQYSSQAPITATLFPGDGIGPEIAEAVKKVFKAADAPIEWDEQYISKTADPRTNSFITRENLDSVLVRPLLPL